MLCLVSCERVALRKRVRHFLPRGGFGVVLKTGYRDDKCWIDKACVVNSEYTEAGNRLLVLAMRRRWKDAYAWICKMLAKGQQSLKMHFISIIESGLFPDSGKLSHCESLNKFTQHRIGKGLHSVGHPVKTIGSSCRVQPKSNWVLEAKDYSVVLSVAQSHDAYSNINVSVVYGPQQLNKQRGNADITYD